MRPQIVRQVRLADNQYIVRHTAIVEEALGKEQIENRLSALEAAVRERIGELHGVLEEIEELKGIVLGVSSDADAKEDDEQPERPPLIDEE